MKVLIITRSFVREVSYLIRYAQQHAFPAEFFVVMPTGSSPDIPSPTKVSFRPLYFADRMRLTCYAPSIFADFRSYAPDILQVFEEFSGLIAFQTVLGSALFGRRCKIMVYSAENLSNNMRAIFRITGKYVAARSDLAFVCSQGVKQVLHAEDFSHPIEVFPLGVDTAIFHKFPAERLKAALKLDGKFVIGYVGRLLGIKGVFLLVDVLRALPESVHLLMVGSGPEELNLRRLAAEYGLEHRVHLAGAIPASNLPEYMNCMDIGIVPSQTTRRWKEQFGRVLVEFMSCEVPVIGSNSGSIPEVLGDAGCIFRENQPQALVDLVNRLMASAEQRRELGERGRARAIAYYSIDVMCEQILSMYRNLEHSCRIS